MVHLLVCSPYRNNKPKGDTMYVVLALLCTSLDAECMVKTYPYIIPSFEACLAVKEDVNKSLYKFAPENASTIKTWCISVPEDT